MHNNIMAAGSKDRPPMLRPGRYAQWRSYKIYSTVDACKTANEMWIAIERIQQGESLNIQDVKTNLLWEFGKFTSHEFSLITPVNEIHEERIAKSANPLALVTAAQPYTKTYNQAPKHQRSYAPAPKHSYSTSSSASTRHKGKEIAKPVTPPSVSDSDEDSDPEQAQKDKEMQKNLALIAKYFKKLYKPTNNNLRTSSNSKNKTKDTTPRKPKRVKDHSYHKEKMLLCKQAEKGVPLQVEQVDWLADTDEEIDEQELEAHYSFMANIQEVLPVESSSTHTPLEQVDQNATEYVDERAALANLTLDTEENKKVLKQLKKANASLTQELKDCNSKLDKSNRALRESNSLLKEKSKVISDLKVKEGKDIDTMIDMDKQIKFVNEILYKRNQSIQTIHMLAPKCSTYNGRSIFANPKYLKKAQSEKPCLYEIPYDTSDPANRFAPNREETVTLANESRSKLNKDTVKPYDYTLENSVYEIFKPPSQTYLDQMEQAKEVRKTM
ncbi:hypothetical protein Tco_0468123 [Tanacetum coccineum]